MSFKFNWKFFDLEDLEARCQRSLTESIATVSRPPVIVKPLQVTAIEFGTIPPELAFHSIPSVSLKRAHVVFDLKYSGDASLTLQTCIEANPFREPYFDPELPEFVQPKVVAATDSLILPFRLKLKKIVLDTLVDVVYTRYGVLVNFHDDPVKSVEAESSLDMIPGVKQLLGGIIRQSITASFYEDIPESVWTVSNPQKQPPTPWFGARRWSQHNKRFVRFASFLVNSLGARSQPFLPEFATLALNVDTPELRLPKAILSRASLPYITQGFNEPYKQNLNPQSLTNLFEPGSETSSIRSSLATSTQSNRDRKPRRRVISLRHLVAKEDNKDPDVGTSPSKRSTSQQHTSTSPGSGSSVPLDNSATCNNSTTTSSNMAVPGMPSSEPHTPPVFASSDEGATDLEDMDESDDLLLGPLDPELSTFNKTQHRRFSTPDGSRINLRKRGPPSKLRTASMQPVATGPLLGTFGPPYSVRSSTRVGSVAPAPHSPRSRMVSTNDLMNK